MILTLWPTTSDVATTYEIRNLRLGSMGKGYPLDQLIAQTATDDIRIPLYDDERREKYVLIECVDAHE